MDWEVLEGRARSACRGLGTRPSPAHAGSPSEGGKPAMPGGVGGGWAEPAEMQAMALGWKRLAEDRSSSGKAKRRARGSRKLSHAQQVLGWRGADPFWGLSQRVCNEYCPSPPLKNSKPSLYSEYLG